MQAQIKRMQQGGLETLRITHHNFQAEVLLQGAHVWRYADARGERLFQSRKSAWSQGKPLRGGIPLCWPWLGIHPEHPEWGLHGPLRTWPFRLQASDSDEEAVSILLSAELPASLPGLISPCKALVHLHFSAAECTVNLEIHNCGNLAQPSAGALHSYLRCDPRSLLLSGLDGCLWHGPDDSNEQGILQGSLSDCVGRTRTLFDGDQPRQPCLEGICTIQRRGSRSLVVWNPGPQHGIVDLGEEEWSQFCCLESANSGPDARLIHPGQTHSLATTYRFQQ